MSYFNVKMPEVQAKFDWDNIDVGNNSLDNSENFFAVRHYEHERLEEMVLLQEELAKTELTDIEEQCVIYKFEKCDNSTTIRDEEDTKKDEENGESSPKTSQSDNGIIKEEHCSSPGNELQENHNNNTREYLLDDGEASSPSKFHTKNSDNGTLCAVEEEQDTEDKENLKSLQHIPNGGVNKEEQCTLQADERQDPHNGIKSESHLDETVPHLKIPSKVKLACQWSTQKPLTSKCVIATSSKGAVSKNMPPPPQAYLKKDEYQRKREEAEKRRAEEERKLREFHPRPVPNFNSYHQMLEKRKPAHTITVAVTPQVLKKSKEAEEKRRKRLEEWKHKSQAPKFESRPPTVLKEKPFIPEKKPMVIKQCPFNLSTEKRLAVRKHYDEAKHKALEEKRKQVEIEEEERKRREEERIRELRKAATFKARPNPFRN
ncbi:uncharacterized protein LOC106095669 isoform X1 [Stomoxys calcitrans]|uniref:uncharacterized protein LOC106095669 isoform X1 n=1 Tax=Stomoxys calcitrans TaxID=35570 RepID=UPI0027E296D7|nr:uncharacterized protein LOC106095669 isoform X1 [Stomoxys calcitrans]